MKSSSLGTVLILFTLGTNACDRASRSGASPTSLSRETVPSVQKSKELGVHSIKLTPLEPDLPPGPGREVFYHHCIVCHSSRYVTNQPPLSRKVWNDEVKKMIRNYGLQIQGEQIDQVVDYLVAVNGPESKLPAN